MIYDNDGCQVFGWTDSTIMQFALWGCLDFPIFFLPAAFLLTYSLRGSVVFFITIVIVLIIVTTTVIIIVTIVLIIVTTARLPVAGVLRLEQVFGASLFFSRSCNWTSPFSVTQVFKVSIIKIILIIIVESHHNHDGDQERG